MNHPFFPKGLLLLCCVILVFACRNTNNAPITYQESSINVYGPYKVIPLSITKGVSVTNPIQLTAGPDRQIFGANQDGKIYSLKDSDGDGLEDEALLFCDVTEQGLHSPAGLVFKSDTLYVGTREGVRIYIDRDKDLRADTNWTFFNDLPSSQHPYEWTSALTFGPDGWLYCSLTTDSWNAGASNDPRGYRGSIIRISPDGKTSERMATGIRSVHGMAFHPEGHLFFVDNQGGGNPVEELNLFSKDAFYGHNPKKYNAPDSVTDPEVKLSTNLAPSGIAFNSSTNDFGGTGGDLFIAFYGPAELWDNGSICRVRIGMNSNQLTYEEIVMADIPKLSALSFGPKGHLYLASHGESDYWYNPIKEKTGGLYRMEYDASIKAPYPVRKTEMKKDNVSASAVEKGKALYVERSCFACHSTDGSTEMLGDPLNGISRKMTREEIRKSIESPSDIIKPSMAGMRITKKDGQIILGRMIHGDQDQLTLILVGNNTITIPRTEIEKTETETKSLMYEGLLNNLSEEEVGYLMDYLESL